MVCWVGQTFIFPQLICVATARTSVPFSAFRAPGSLGNALRSNISIALIDEDTRLPSMLMVQCSGIALVRRLKA